MADRLERDAQSGAVCRCKQGVGHRHPHPGGGWAGAWTFQSGSSDGFFASPMPDTAPAAASSSGRTVWRPMTGPHTVQIRGLQARNGQDVPDFTYEVTFFGGRQAENDARPESSRCARTGEHRAGTRAVRRERAAAAADAYVPGCTDCPLGPWGHYPGSRCGNRQRIRRRDLPPFRHGDQCPF